MQIVLSNINPNDLKNFIEKSLNDLSMIEEKLIQMESGSIIDLVETTIKPLDFIKDEISKYKQNEIPQILHNVLDILTDLSVGSISPKPEIIEGLLSAIVKIGRIFQLIKESVVKDSSEFIKSISIEVENISYVEIMKDLQGIYSLVNNQTGGGKISAEKKNGFDLNADLFPQFITESMENISIIEHNLLEAESKPKDKEIINSTFRALHSLKGGAGLMISTSTGIVPEKHSLVVFRDLSHVAESLLQKIRDNNQELTLEVMNTLFSVVDNLKILMNKIRDNVLSDDSFVDLITEIKAHLGGDFKAQKKEKSGPQNESGGSEKIDDQESRLRAFLNVGTQSIEAIEKHHKQIEEQGIKIDSKTTDKYIRNIKSLISAATYQNYTELLDILKQMKDLLNSVKEGKTNFDNILWELLVELFGKIRNFISKAEEKAKAALPQSKVKTFSDPLAVPKIKEQGTGEWKTFKTQQGDAKKSGEFSDTIRVNYEKVDKLMNLIGELVVAKNIFSHLAKKLSVEYNIPQIGREVKEIGSTINRIADDLQNTIMEVRMLPIKNVFQKFPRMIRDISKATGKEVELILEGEETYLDKTIIEKINDPLIHLLRNSVDHGIEDKEKRISKGKNPIGTVKLKAETHGNIVSIEISDDGKGLNAEEMKLKALEKELISIDQVESLTNRQAYELMFLPGFSTAKNITEFSGRGVGMDVVKTNVLSLGGSVQVESELGKGTTIKLLLPLTLVISKGLLVEVTKQQYIIPLESIQETVRIKTERIHRFKNYFITEIRGEVINLIPLSHIFNLEEFRIYVDKLLSSSIVSIVILNINGQKAGLVVDDFSNEEEIVIKPLDHELAKIRGISGATIMGDGKIVLILNPNEIMQLMFKQLKEENS